MDKQFTRKEIKSNIQRLRRSIISRKIKKSEIHYQVYDLQQFVGTTDSNENDGGEFARCQLFKLVEELMIRTDLPN
jgi:hypothetical protein